MIFFSLKILTLKKRICLQNLIQSRRERESFFKILNFERRTRIFFLKILTIENISRNEHSILQLEIEKNGPFPRKIFSRARISSMPGWEYISGKCVPPNILHSILIRGSNFFFFEIQRLPYLIPFHLSREAQNSFFLF